MQKKPKKAGDGRVRAEEAAQMVLAKHPTVIPSPCSQSEPKVVRPDEKRVVDSAARNITRFLAG